MALEKILKVINDGMKKPKIMIKPNLVPVQGGDAVEAEKGFVVVIRKEGVFELKGKVVDLEGLRDAMEAAVKKTNEKPLLKIRANDLADEGFSFKGGKGLVKNEKMLGRLTTTTAPPETAIAGEDKKGNLILKNVVAFGTRSFSMVLRWCSGL